MQATVTCKQGTHTFDFDGSENGLYQKLGELFKWIPAPDTISVLVGTRTVIIDRALGKFGQPFNKISYSDLEGLTPSILPWKLLKKIDDAKNIYNQYEMIPHNLGNRTMSFSESAGRIGAIQTDINRIKLSNYQNDPLLFWIKYYDRLAEGYVDFTEMSEQNLPDAPILGQKQKKARAEIVQSAITPAYELYKTLLQAAEEFVVEQLEPGLLEQKAPFTEIQIEKAREIWNTLGKSKNVEQFNSKVKKILALAPRRIDAYHGQTVKSYLAQEVADPDKQQEIYAAIIEREDALIQSMEAILLSRKSGKPEEVVSRVFEGITISQATKEEVDKLKNTMFNADSASKNLKKHVKRVWKIDDPRQNKKFDAYVNERKVCGTKYLFHGSRTQNWISIINNSLMLNPNAQINGKAFGYGIYFALSADKSFGYTSASWGNRYNSDAGSCGYMGVYETAYGKSANSGIVHDYSQEWMDKNGYDCLHYHAGGSDGTYSFVRDEIVFYSESAMTIRYLIEFGPDSDED